MPVERFLPLAALEQKRSVSQREEIELDGATGISAVRRQDAIITTGMYTDLVRAADLNGRGLTVSELLRQEEREREKLQTATQARDTYGVYRHQVRLNVVRNLLQSLR